MRRRHGAIARPATQQALQERLNQLHEQHPDARFHVRIDAAGQYAINLELFLRGLDLPMTVSVGELARRKARTLSAQLLSGATEIKMKETTISSSTSP